MANSAESGDKVNIPFLQLRLDHQREQLANSADHKNFHGTKQLIKQKQPKGSEQKPEVSNPIHQDNEKSLHSQLVAQLQIL